MKPVTLSLTLSRRLSDDNFGSFGADFTMEVELEKGDDPKECRKKLRKMVLSEVEAALEATKEALPAKKKGSK
jgi:hypothetical protein